MLLLQAQTGWLQHDFGHLSVFKKSKWDHFFHYLTVGFLKVKPCCGAGFLLDQTCLYTPVWINIGFILLWNFLAIFFSEIFCVLHVSLFSHLSFSIRESQIPINQSAVVCNYQRHSGLNGYKSLFTTCSTRAHSLKWHLNKLWLRWVF